MITRLHTIGAVPAHVMQITGHRGEDAQSVHYGTYTHDVGLQALAETIGRLAYGLDYQAIRLDDPRFSSFLKRWQMVANRNEKLNQ